MNYSEKIRHDVETYLLYPDDDTAGAIENAKTDYFTEDFDEWLESMIQVLVDELNYNISCEEVLDIVKSDEELLDNCREEHADLYETLVDNDCLD